MEEKPTLRVLLADDQANVRHALQLLLEQEPGITIVGEAADATGVLLAAATHPADVLLLDWELPGLPLPHLLKLLQFERPSLQIIAMSSRPEAQIEALGAGAVTFLSKGAPPETVRNALHNLKHVDT
jgi:DNA-binding NarL/FixJ family response regulator